MAAPTQTTANKSGLSYIAQDTAENVSMFDFGGVKIGFGTGTPNAEVTAPKGSLFIELGGPDLYMNTDGVKAWELVGGQT